MIATESQPNIRYSAKANTRSETLPEKKTSNDSVWLFTCHISCPIWPRKEKVFWSLFTIISCCLKRSCQTFIISIIIGSWFTSILCQVIPYSLCFFSNSLWFIDHHLKQKYPLSINTLFYQCKYWLKFNIFKEIKTIRHQRPPLVLWSIWCRIGKRDTSYC